MLVVFFYCILQDPHLQDAYKKFPLIDITSDM